MNKRLRTVALCLHYKIDKWNMNRKYEYITLFGMAGRIEPATSKVKFDTDSAEVGIDNRTSFTMSGYVKDFITPIQPTNNYRIRGISGAHLNVDGIGTIKWRIEDDNGVQHDVLIPNSLYIKKFEGRLLSPQHWSQVSNDHYPDKDGTVCVTGGMEAKLLWNQRKNVKTIPIDPTNNCFTFRTCSGMSKYQRFNEIFQKEKMGVSEKCMICMDISESMVSNEKNHGKLSYHHTLS